MLSLKRFLMPLQGINKVMSAGFSSQSTTSSNTGDEDVLNSLDPTQVQLMKETCILVNDKDQVVGAASKKTCHLLKNIEQGMLHRAFSVFLFNERNELLLQQRSDEKITFPSMFTNTCCSHPLDTMLEKEEKDAMGVKRAAQRKLYHELGITPDQVPLNLFHFITRIKYKAENVPRDSVFGEHEIDYVLFVQKNVDVHRNKNEVKTYKYVNKEELKYVLQAAEKGEIAVTPWFKLICESFLLDWWSRIDNMESIQDHATIHSLS